MQVKLARMHNAEYVLPDLRQYEALPVPHLDQVKNSILALNTNSAQGKAAPDRTKSSQTNYLKRTREETFGTESLSRK